MKPGFFTVAIFALLASLAGARAAVPDFGDNMTLEIAPYGESAGNRPALLRMAQDFVPLESVLAELRAHYPGRQLSVSGPSRSDDGYVYRIKWLTEDGAVLYVVADAQTGAILSVEGE